MGLIPWSPLGGGLLGGALEKASPGRRTSDEFKKDLEKSQPKIEAYEKLCRELGEKPGVVESESLRVVEPGALSIFRGRDAGHALEHGAEGTDVLVADPACNRIDRLAA